MNTAMVPRLSLRSASLLTLLAVLLALVPQPALAVDFRGSEMTVIEAGTTVNDDLYAFGNVVEIRGIVNGDVIAGASTVTISGTINGDLLAAAGTIQVPGEVQGSIRASGGNLVIDGTVRDDVLVGGGTLQIGRDASIGRDVVFGGGTIALNGQVARDALIGGGEATLGGTVNGNVRAEVGQLTVADGAVIGGNLVYRAEQGETISPSATVSGETQRLATPEAAEPTATDAVTAAVIGWLRALVGMMLVGLALVLLFPAFSRRATQSLTRSPWPSVGIGLALLVGVPALMVLVLIVGIFVGGWWLAPIILGLYAAALVVGYAISGLLVGRLILAQVGREHLHQIVALLIGLAILLLVGIVPILGWIVGLVAAIAGLGALGRAAWLTQHHEAAMAPA